MLTWKRWVNSISSQKVLFLDSLFLFWTAFHKNSVRKKKRKDKEIIYVVWYIHYQENTIVLGTTELQCLCETRGRVPSWVWQRPTGKSTKMRGKLLCSGVGIKNSYKHRVQSADIDVIFSRMLKNWAVYNVNRGNAQAMTVISVLEHSSRWWQTSVAYYDML